MYTYSPMENFGYTIFKFQYLLKLYVVGIQEEIYIYYSSLKKNRNNKLNKDNTY